MNPYDWRGYGRAKRRAEQILVLLRRRGVTGEAEDGLARAELERIAVQPKPRRAELALHAVLRIEELLAAELRAGVDHPLRLSTTLDLELQEQVALAAEETVAALASAGAENGAVIVAERETGAVLAYVGSTGYLREDQGGAIDFARTPRSAGSTLKPFIFAAALEKKVIGPTTILDDLSRGPSGLINMDQNYLGPMLPRAALGNSRNVPAARLLEELGVGRTYDVLGDLSLHRRELPADHYGTGLAVGALPVTLEDLAAAYGALAREGGWSPLSYWPEQRRVTRRIFSEHTARQVTSFLSDPLARLPTFPRLGPTEYRFPVAIKTGTSQGFRDAWTVAYSARFLVAAWIGRPDARPMHNLTGLRSAAILVRRVLEPLHAADAQGLRDLSFPAPDGHRPVRVCGLSGHRATPACDHTFVEHLEPAAAAAIEDCPVHVAPGMVELPPKYARWAAEQYFTASPAGKSFIEPAEELVAPAIVQPERGSRVWIDPETPPELSTLALEVEVEDSVEEIVWWVDGQPFAIVHAPFTARWPLSRGRHVFEARIPYTPYRSDPVAVIVE
jgi:penicillin-binding protein 1C